MQILKRTPEMVADIYFSFAGDEGFRGAVVVAIDDPAAALEHVNHLGLNPGGQVAVMSILHGTYPTDRLLSREEIDGTRLGDLAPEERDAFKLNSLLICEDCNS